MFMYIAGTIGNAVVMFQVTIYNCKAWGRKTMDVEKVEEETKLKQS